MKCFLSKDYGKTFEKFRNDIAIISGSSDKIIDIIAEVALDGVSALVGIVYVGIYKKKE